MPSADLGDVSIGWTGPAAVVRVLEADQTGADEWASCGPDLPAKPSSGRAASPGAAVPSRRRAAQSRPPPRRKGATSPRRALRRPARRGRRWRSGWPSSRRDEQRGLLAEPLGRPPRARADAGVVAEDIITNRRAAITARIAGVGLVTVSDLRSIGGPCIGRYSWSESCG